MSGLPSWARVGAKVVYVGGGAPRGYRSNLRTARLGKGTVYTIRGILADPLHPDILGVWLVGIVNPPHPTLGIEGGYLLSGFRPPVTLESDIATHFAQYLKTDHRATRKAGIDA